MILSVSRRTDIPAFYADWFFHRLQAGYVLVRNPYRFHAVSRIALSPDVVDGIVFWTKNPAPMLARLNELRDYPFYFQCTATAYGTDLEVHVPDKDRAVLPAMRRLAKMIGPERVIWRYDPVLLSQKYTVDFHRQRFSQMAKALAGSTKRCVISFLDMYPAMQKETNRLGLRVPDRQEAETLAAYFADIAAQNGIKAETCAENIDLAHLGIAHGCCIDKALLEKIGGFKLHTKKDLNQRPFCGCCASVDIGTYATCPGGCVYCYANRGAAAAKNAFAAHDAHAPLLLGPLLPDDIVTEKVMRSEKDTQMQLFL
ncbi:MAG TPA: DUF1848 domain-containing protein [Candidatus Scubalenecus merdavium]|uniref:DUF1848 domain-containing protein n=1 Tax=Candidatus Scybalenecus merdavium TaxID=2840939 RepID=A0A9D1MUX6_9FIRM|nr:DUF1848 domain-containing protein [Candidatus Scubalenecus merdavium]